MTEAEMRRALGVLIEALADIAFDTGPELDPPEVQDLLVKAGLATEGVATEEQAANCRFGATEPGDPWVALTPFALMCRKMARGGGA